MQYWINFLEPFVSPSNPLADSIQALFVQAKRSLEPERASALAREISSYGGLEQAIAVLAQDEAYVVLGDALAYRALLIERNEPARLIARLLREAKDLDARADPAWAEAAELSGRAAYCRVQGEPEPAEQFQVRAQAAQTLAASFEEQALLKRLQVAELKADTDLAQVLHDLAA